MKSNFCVIFVLSSKDQLKLNIFKIIRKRFIRVFSLHIRKTSKKKKKKEKKH